MWLNSQQLLSAGVHQRLTQSPLPVPGIRCGSALSAARLDGHLREQGNPPVGLGADACLSVEFGKSPGENPQPSGRSVQKDKYSSQIGARLWPKGLTRDQCFKDNKPNEMSGTNNTCTHRNPRKRLLRLCYVLV